MSWIKSNTSTVVGWIILIVSLAYTVGVTAESSKLRITSIEKDVIEIKTDVKELHEAVHKLDKLVVRLEVAVIKIEE